MSGQLAAQAAYAAGFRGEDLVDMVAIAKRESGWRPDAHRTDRDKSQLSGDRGLFQINYIWDDQLRAAGIISSPQDLFDPMVNARAAKYVMDNMGYSAWGVGTGGWQQGGDPFHGTDRQEAAQIVNSTDLGGERVSVPLGSSEEESVGTIPKDAKLYQNDFGVWAVVNPEQGVHIGFHVPFGTPIPQGKPVSRLSNAQWNEMFPDMVDGGHINELGPLTEGGTFTETWERLLDGIIGPNNPARYDPEILQVAAKVAADPEILNQPDRLEQLIQQTEWWKTRTDAEREWDDLSPAEQGKRRDEAAARMIAEWERHGGVYLDVEDPRVANYLDDVASGKMGLGAFSELVQSQAADLGESPEARRRRDEDEAKRSRGITVENTANNVRGELRKWGVQWSNEEVMRWAKEMVENLKSDDDLRTTLKQQAMVLYPWKDPEMETSVAAMPWIETYRRVMEKPGSLETSEIQRALQGGQAVWDFEQQLKKSPDWLGTKNGQSSVYTAAAEMGRRMGFV